MRFTATHVEGVVVVEVEPIADDRGFFGRLFCRQEFAEQGLASEFVQTNVGVSTRSGTLRGLHYQRSPHGEAKLVRCSRGALYDVAVDLRAHSPTYLKWVGLNLEADGRTMLYVPEGCAHGYLTLEDETELVYATTRAYAPDAATGVHYADRALGIDWPGKVEVISEQDGSWPAINP